MDKRLNAARRVAVLLGALGLLLSAGCRTTEWVSRNVSVANPVPSADEPVPPAAPVDTATVVALATDGEAAVPAVAPVVDPVSETVVLTRLLRPMDVTNLNLTPEQREIQRLREEVTVMNEVVTSLTTKVEELQLQARFFSGASFEALGEYGEAIETYKKILETNPASPYAADSCFKIGSIYKNRLNDYDGAIRYFQRLISGYAGSPRLKSAYFALGEAYTAKGEYESANGYYRRLIANFPGSDKAAEAQYEVAQNLSRAGNLAGAIEECRALLSRYPNSQMADDAQYRIGEYHRAQRQWSEAIVAFQRVLEKYPRSGLAPFAQFEIGETYVELNNLPAARTAFETYLRKYPDAVYVERAKLRLDSLR